MILLCAKNVVDRAAVSGVLLLTQSSEHVAGG